MLCIFIKIHENLKLSSKFLTGHAQEGTNYAFTNSKEPKIPWTVFGVWWEMVVATYVLGL